jgi:hypothetical protein
MAAEAKIRVNDIPREADAPHQSDDAVEATLRIIPHTLYLRRGKVGG